MARKKLQLPKKAVARSWSEDDAFKAIEAVQEKRMTVYKAAKSFKIPKTTMKRLVEFNKDRDVGNYKLPEKGRPSVLGEMLEKQLVSYAIAMERRYFGVTRRDLRKCAGILAAKKGIPNPFEDGDGGRGWCDLFLRRHRAELSIRQTSGVSRARIRGFTKEAVNGFYDLLQNEYETHFYPANRIYNVDETGISVCPSKYPKVVAKKGKQQVGALAAAERGALVTVVCCMNANGDFVPPHFIFPRKKENTLLLKHAPPGSIASFHSSGWMQNDVFVKWFRHFVTHTNPTAENPILLLLDGHYCHTRNVEFLELAKEMHVCVISLPPHCSHRIQPLDRSFMGPLKTYYNEALRQFTRMNQRVVTLYDIAECFNEAYVKARTPNNAVEGFRVTGIYPLNRNIFQDSDFLQEAHKREDRSNRSISSMLTSYISPSFMTSSNFIPSISFRSENGGCFIV